jgi:hypothetical protein
MGLIGIDEYIERCVVAQWLDEEGKSGDPREPGLVVQLTNTAKFYTTMLRIKQKTKRRNAESNPICCGSHLETDGFSPVQIPIRTRRHLTRISKARIAFGQSLIHIRLGKREMKDLWGDQAFRNFCRSHILWLYGTISVVSISGNLPVALPKVVTP